MSWSINAVKFSPANTPVTIVGRVEWPWFHLHISDQGPGLTPEQISQVGAFIQFERNQNRTTGAPAWGWPLPNGLQNSGAGSLS